MALTDAYVTVADFRARIGEKSDGADSVLTAQLLNTQRELERALGLHLGAFNSHTGTYIFPAHGGTVLRLRDSAGRGYFLQSITADKIEIDSDADGTYGGYALDLADGWVRGIPENAAAFSEPYTALELLPLSDADPTCWPDASGAVRITGTWGWAAVPGIIVDLICHRTNEMRTAFKEGGLGTVPAFGTEGTMRPSTAWLWREVEAMYGRWIPVGF